jgi:DNA-directed RNA polymerase subunit RPC12/RpoP
MTSGGSASGERLIFVSYNSADRDTARAVAVQLQLAGADAWIDEWKIQAGDSIPGSIDEALSRFDTFVVLWSAHAARSKWVRTELEAALVRAIDEPSLRVVPVVLDDTPLPTLLRPLKYLTIDDGVGAVVDGILGFATVRARLRAIQAALEAARVEVRYFFGYGAAAGCLRCGAGVEALEQWAATDYERDDEYAGVRCTECGWEDGGEI